MNPTARVEYALRADDLLTEPQVRQIMEYYLAVRMRRYGRPFQPTDGAPTTSERPGERQLGRPGRAAAVRWASTGHPARSASVSGPSARLDPQSAPGTRPLLAHFQGTARTALHVRASGTANAGVWGAGVRDSGATR